MIYLQVEWPHAHKITNCSKFRRPTVKTLQGRRVAAAVRVGQEVEGSQELAGLNSALQQLYCSLCKLLAIKGTRALLGI